MEDYRTVKDCEANPGSASRHSWRALPRSASGLEGDRIRRQDQVGPQPRRRPPAPNYVASGWNRYFSQCDGFQD